MTTEELVDLIEELRRARTDTLHVEAKRAEQAHEARKGASKP